MDDDSTQQIHISALQGTSPVESRSLGTYFEYIAASLTHIGCKRTLNEDACLNLTDRHLWVVADGMGGHMAGDVASQTVIEYAQKAVADQTFSIFVENVEDQFIAANQKLRELGKKRGQIAGSTVVALLGHGRQGLIMWAGDSRAYLFRNNSLHQITRDHSLVEELLAMGSISADEARSHPRANVITRAIGANENLVLDMDIVEFLHGDTILLCSDGLYRELHEEDIGDLIRNQASPATITQKLVDACLERQARDNVAVVVVKVIRPL